MSVTTQNHSQQKYFESPQVYNVIKEPPRLSLFLGGGISSCPDWQLDVREQLEISCPNLVLLNPRRTNFDAMVTKLDEQIEWEFHHLRKATAILFWFPAESICPITLFELGQWAALGIQHHIRLFVGCHPNYQRRNDIIKQLELINGSIRVVLSLEEICAQIETWYAINNSEADEHHTTPPILKYIECKLL